MYSFINLRSKFVNEFGRKIIHVSVCFTSYFIGSRLDLFWLLMIFALVILISFLAERFGLLKFFNDVDRRSYGHYFMAVGVLVTLLIYRIFGNQIPGNHSALVFAFLALGVADVLAVLGKPLHRFLVHRQGWDWMNKYLYGGKTLTGSLIFFTVSLILAWVLIFLDPILLTNLVSNPLWTVSKVAIFLLTLTLVERYSLLGVDNIFIPVIGYTGFWIALLV